MDRRRERNNAGQTDTTDRVQRLRRQAAARTVASVAFKQPLIGTSASASVRVVAERFSPLWHQLVAPARTRVTILLTLTAALRLFEADPATRHRPS